MPPPCERERERERRRGKGRGAEGGHICHALRSRRLGVFQEPRGIGTLPVIFGIGPPLNPAASFHFAPVTRIIMKETFVVFGAVHVTVDLRARRRRLVQRGSGRCSATPRAPARTRCQDTSVSCVSGLTTNCVPSCARGDQWCAGFRAGKRGGKEERGGHPILDPRG